MSELKDSLEAKTELDTRLDTTPPGSMWRHPKTKGWYWRLRSNMVSPNLRGAGRFTQIPLVPAGRDRGATRSKALAVRCQRRLWREWSEHAAGIAPPAMETVLADFARYNANRANPTTVASNQSQIRRFVEHSGVTRAVMIDDLGVQAFLDALRAGWKGGRPAGDRTVERYRNTLHKFCGWLYRRHVIDANPVDLVEVRGAARRPPQVLTIDEIAALMRRAAGPEAPPWLSLAVAIGVYSGLRVSEIRSLRWQDLGERAITVGSSVATKTRDYRHVPVEPPLGARLSRLRRGQPGENVFTCQDERAWLSTMAAATEGLPKFGDASGRQSAGRRWHILRSTYAVHQVLGTWTGEPATLWQLMSWLGHRVPTTTMRYLDLAAAMG